MKKLTKKLLMSIISVIFCMVALGTSTYAWFTLSNVATVSEISVEVEDLEGIEVSLDGVQWRQNLTLTDLASELIDITSPNGLTFLDDNNVATTSGYLTYTLYFRMTGTTYTKIYVDEITPVYSTDFSWVCDASVDTNGDGDYADPEDLIAGNEYTFNALNAMKVSFGAYTGIDVTNLTTSGTAPTTAKVYGIEMTSGTIGRGTPSINGLAKKYLDAKGYTAGDLSATFPTYITELDSANFTILDNTTLVADANNEYRYGKIVVNIWLEGWDPDCINAIASQTDRKMNFTFKAE